MPLQCGFDLREDLLALLRGEGISCRADHLSKNTFSRQLTVRLQK
jgi:hypothetical protein